MSVKIRLARIGKKNSPTFRIVVSQTRTKRNGKFLDILGDFNPAMGNKPVIDKAKVDDWIKKGAVLTSSVKDILDGKYHYVKYNPKAEKEVAKE